jgi:hypothetical protein
MSCEPLPMMPAASSLLPPQAVKAATITVVRLMNGVSRCERSGVAMKGSCEWVEPAVSEAQVDLNTV